MHQPIFNIIYIPGTVDFQTPALISLLLNSDFHFRLVGNALGKKEAMLLQSLSKSSERLTYMNYESKQIIPHGTLLDILFNSESHKLFCFCDSDLFLFESLDKTPQELLGHADVVSSGGRIENDNEAQYAGFRGGATTLSPDGEIPLAMSFFSIYKRKSLQKVFSKYKVGFEQYRSKNQIPAEVLGYLKRQNIEFDMFDTGKLLSVLFHKENLSNKYLSLNQLIHLGGMSGRYLQNLNLSETQTLAETELSKTSDCKDSLTFRSDYEKELKRFFGKYFFIYLKHMIGKSTKPKLKIKSKDIQSKIHQLESQIQNILNTANDYNYTKKMLLAAREEYEI